MEQSSSSALTLRRENNSLSTPLVVEPSLYPLPPQGERGDEDLPVKAILIMLRRRSLIIVGVAIMVFAAIAAYTLTRQPLYGGRFRILIEPINSTDSLLSGLPARQGDSFQSILDYETQIQVLLNPALIGGTLEKLQQSYPNLKPQDVIGNLAIERMQNTRILEVRYNSISQSEVLAVLDQLAADFLTYSSDERQTNLRQGIRFIDEQLPVIRARVDELQRELQGFREQNNFIDPESQSTLIISLTAQLDQERVALEQGLAQAQASYATLQGSTGALAALNEAPVYQQLLSQLRQIDATIAAELTRFNDDALAIRALRDQRQRLLPVLEDEAKRVVGQQLAVVATQMQVLEVQRQTNRQATAEAQQRLRNLPTLIRRYTDLQRELVVSTDNLTRFLAARESLQIEASQREIPWQIVEAPILFGAPISPKVFRNLVLGLVGGTILGLSAGFIVEKLDDVYHTAEDLRAKTGLPLLGTVPRQRGIEELDDLLLQERTVLMNLDSLTPARSDKHLLAELGAAPVLSQRSSQFLAAFQVLCTKIQLLKPDHPVRSLVVTSASAGDGKTTTALYLAQAAAEMGLRVLLVDADLRQSALRTRLNLDAPKGLSNLIAQSLSLGEVIYQPLRQPGFYFLPAGDIPPTPVSILSSEKMKQVMAEVAHRFDLVIYDVPPMEGLADASLLAPHTDGILLVVRVGRTERFAIVQTLDNIKLAQMPILGLVANGLK